jgi:glycosyltransferase involved in cell wall biosynthesis
MPASIDSDNKGLVSIIMPVYNAGRYLGAAIDSVLQQSYQHWELFIIDDGSTDDSAAIIRQYNDERIHPIFKRKEGVSAARNSALSIMKGDFFCFLDADDMLSVRSLEIRVLKFHQNPTIAFLDGEVIFFKGDVHNVIRHYKPSFKGKPLNALFRLDERCFAGLTWMVRSLPGIAYSMERSITHGEDLLFFMQLTRTSDGEYASVDQVIYYYRQHPHSAMRDLDKLEAGYRELYSIIKRWREFTIPGKMVYHFKTRKIIFLEWMSRKNIKRALLALLR